MFLLAQHLVDAWQVGFADFAFKRQAALPLGRLFFEDMVSTLLAPDNFS